MSHRTNMLLAAMIVMLASAAPGATAAGPRADVTLSNVNPASAIRPGAALKLPAGDGRVAVVVGALRGLAKDGGSGYFDWTFLCSDDGNHRGETSVAEYDGYSYFNASGSGLAPGVAVTLRANGLEVGTVTADEWGFVWIDAAAGEPPWPPGGPSMPAALFELPEALLPVSEIEAVELLVDGAAVLAGNFASPCMEEPPMPVEAGSIQLCDPDSAWSGGFFDWAVFDSGLVIAGVAAYGLPPAITVELAVDGIDLASAPVLDDGSLWLSFSSAPMQGELPLPPEVLPLSDTQEVTVASEGTVLLSGTPNTICPCPGPIEMGSTPLCFDDGGLPPASRAGEIGWAVYAEDIEELWVWASGLEPSTAYGLTVDGHSLGSHPSDDWGSLWIGFSTTGASGQLPLPEEIRPVSAIDQVTLDVAGTVVGSGSFSDPCTPPPPPMPVESGGTLLCPQGAQPASGDVHWSLWDDGYEELYISAYFLVAGAEYDLVVDGFSLGGFAADTSGYLFASFASTPQWDGQLPLPAAVRPVSAVDAVELRDAAGGAVAAGSFSDPCTEMPVFNGASTALCGGDGVMYGMGSWWTASLAGATVAEGIDILLWPPDSSLSYHAVIDGVEVGELEPRPWEGSLMLSLGTSSEHPVPPELEPVEGIDLVQVLTADGAIAYEGSFSEPCTPEGGDPGPLSGLHDVPASAPVR
jgi:hypothetical protein